MVTTSLSRLVVVGASVLALSACSHGAPRGEEAPAATTGAPASQESAVREADMTHQLGPNAYERLTLIPDERGGTSQGLEAISPDGTLLLNVSKPYDIEAPLEKLHQTWIELAQTDSDHRQRIVAPAGPRPRQHVGSDLSDRFVVWMESAAMDLGVEPWVMFAYDRATGVTRELARAPKVDGRVPPPPPGYTDPVIAGDRVFWAQVGGEFGAETVDIMGCQIKRCQPRVTISGAAYPAAASGSLYAVRTARYQGFKDSKRATPAVVARLDLNSGQISPVKKIELDRHSHVDGLAASGAGIAWILNRQTSDTAGISHLTILESSGDETTIESSVGEFDYPVMTNRFVAWAEASGNAPSGFGGYIFDLKTRKQSTIGNTMGLYGLEARGDIIAWQMSKSSSPKPGDTSYVVARLK